MHCEECGSEHDVAWVLTGYDSEVNAPLYECAACHLRRCGTEYAGLNPFERAWERNLWRLQRHHNGVHPMACESCDQLYDGACGKCYIRYSEAVWNARNHLDNCRRFGWHAGDDILAALRLGEKAGTDLKWERENPYLTSKDPHAQLLLGAWWHGRECMWPAGDEG